MNLKALVTFLVLGTSSAAIAAPNAPTFAPEVRDHRTPQRMERWSLLASGNLARGRDLIAIDQKGRHGASEIDKLKLELTGRGSLFVDKLVVSFGNGRSQTIKVNKTLTLRDQAVIVDVAGRNRKITSIAVYGRGSGNGVRAGASFNVLAL